MRRPRGASLPGPRRDVHARRAFALGPSRIGSRLVRPLLLVLLLATAAVAEDRWRKVDVEEGVLVETRDVEGSSLHEVRATAHTKASPAAIVGVLWKQEEFPQFLDHVKRIDVLRDGPSERLLYEEFSVPILKDRDIVVRARRTTDSASGVVDMESIAVSDEGPPATSRCVRIQTSVSRWHLAPAADGADITYTIRADVGGYVPAWIANRVQHETVPVLVRKVLDRAEAGERASAEQRERPVEQPETGE